MGTLKHDHEAWLERHTFRCAVGRVTPKQCEELRARPTLQEIVQSGTGRRAPYLSPAAKPRVCQWCTDWEDKMREFERRPLVMEQAEAVTAQVQTKDAPPAQADGGAKVCRSCRQKKSASEFYPDRKARDGLRASVDLGRWPLPKHGARGKRLVIEVEVGDELTISGRRYVVAKRLAPFKFLITPQDVGAATKGVADAGRKGSA